jgi:hypothetical protein
VANKPAIITAEPGHIRTIAAGVRLDDLRELEGLSSSPDLILRLSLRSSVLAWTGTVDDVPVCMFGVSPGELGEGRPWMIGTADLDRFAVIFLRRCRAEIEKMLNSFPVLVNYISVDNVRAIEWLRWLGFTISPPLPWGPRRLLFHRFELRRES